MIRIAHLSDLHINNVSKITYKELFSKRLCGYCFWKSKKHKLFDYFIFDEIKKDIGLEKPDHIVITGDLTQLCTASEFKKARNYIQTLGANENITIIPGNHDFYTFAGKSLFYKEFCDFFSVNNYIDTKNYLPFVKIIGNCAIIGINSAVVTPPFFSYGHLKKSQLEHLGLILKKLQYSYFNILLIHHPPIKGIIYKTKSLLNSRELIRILETGSINLVLHGHIHRFNLSYFNYRETNIPIISAPAMAFKSNIGIRSGGYNMYKLYNCDKKWKIDLERKVYNIEKKSFDTEVIKVL
ncbi:MAG: metallophosphoesterase [Deferribacterota bacterium]|nr:metallophosphoesterase [Deferribacterota bacterium]